MLGGSLERLVRVSGEGTTPSSADAMGWDETLVVGWLHDVKGKGCSRGPVQCGAVRCGTSASASASAVQCRAVQPRAKCTVLGTGRIR